MYVHSYPLVENYSFLIRTVKISKYKQYKHKSGRVRESKNEEIRFSPPVPAHPFLE